MFEYMCVWVCVCGGSISHGVHAHTHLDISQLALESVSLV